MYNYDINNEICMVFFYCISLYIYVLVDQFVVNYFFFVYKVIFFLQGEIFIFGFLLVLLDSFGIFYNFDKIFRKKCIMI